MNEQEKSANSQRLFFDEHQWVAIEAAMARIIPTDDTPGAREAGAIYFLDRYLSGLDYIYAKPDGSGFLKLHGKKADSWQQRIETICQPRKLCPLERHQAWRFCATGTGRTELQSDSGRPEGHWIRWLDNGGVR